ncbi:MAG: mandelate racemase/muconate lactonizing enzyme family protein [Acidimicrobiales bacterium]|nr:mandelate racemase/muconate lactonizing enzyme family protein [Acidimicrobiales bacterium]
MPALSIRSVEVVPLEVPLSESPARRFAQARGDGAISVTAVYVHTNGGPTGFGYTTQIGSRAGAAIAAYIRDELAPRLEGAEALAPEAIWHRLWNPSKSRMRAGLAVHALSALDIACWDITAKVAGLPLHTILGGFRREVPVYGSGGTPNYTDAELVAECRYFADRGLTSYKFKIGEHSVAEGHSSDVDRIALLRKEVGDGFTLFVDANQRYRTSQAIEVSKMLHDFGIAWFEEPVLADSVADLAAVAARSEVPVAAGENHYLRWEFRELCEARAVSYLQPDPVLCGGVTEFRKAAHLADAFDLSLCSHLSHELAVSLVGAFPSGYACEYFMQFPDELWSREFPLHNGHLIVPDVPGHGLDLGSTARRRYGVD